MTSTTKASNLAVVVKSFVDAINNIYNIFQSQLPTPCGKEDKLIISILEDEYKLSVEACKHNLRERVVWSNESSPLTIVSLRHKLSKLWKSIGKCGITSFGKVFFRIFLLLFGKCSSRSFG